MSATLDTGLLAERMKQVPIITCEGKRYPVETIYLGPLENSDFVHLVAKTIYRLLLNEPGNILVFLPGAGEIRRVEKQLNTFPLTSTTLIAPLYGDLPPKAQDLAILPPPRGWRKVVLATNIAETSLTIEGIRIVLDTGLMRVPRFDPRSGMTRLRTVTVSQASAEQRRGRAGRLEPGLCIRCWSEQTQQSFVPRNLPEILQADLTPLALELAAWGIRHPADLFWLDAPPEASLAKGQHLLQSLGALDPQGRITEHGRKMADLPVHPRLAHMILQGCTIGLGPLACDLAAVLSERNFLKSSETPRQADLRFHMEEFYRKLSLDTGTEIIRRIRRASRMWQQSLNISVDSRKDTPPIERVGILIALAYPDRIAQRQPDGSRRYKLTNGRLATFHQPDPLEQEEFLVVPDLDGTQPVSRVYLASPVLRDDLFTQSLALIETKERVEWNDATESVVANREECLGELVLEVKRLSKPDPDLVIAALLEGIRRKGLTCLPWTKEQRLWQARVQFLHRLQGPESDWPDVSDYALLRTLESWLSPFLTEISNLVQLKRLDITWPLQAKLTVEQRRTIDILAPTHMTVPTGSRIALDYKTGEIPILAVRLQELFGMTETPCIANGKVMVLIHLLSPARRPVQVTQDLRSFWERGYPEVKKELKGRYPKHSWPDDPLQAPPTRGIQRR